MATFIPPSSSETVAGTKVARRDAPSEKLSVLFLNRLGNLPIGGLICLAMVLGWFHAFHGQHSLAQTPTAGQSTAVHWLPLADCPVQSQNVVEVPAKDTGLLEKLEVELNATVKRGQTLAILEQELTDIELKIAKLQHAVAVEQAADDGEVRLRKLALKAAEELLASNSEIA
ncbi:MAG: hypothetical protein IT423_16425, partial [Pirellulaceae bacterium]|nr:hypothetical protein [Pirellulaceae bacterium]